MRLSEKKLTEKAKQFLNATKKIALDYYLDKNKLFFLSDIAKELEISKKSLHHYLNLYPKHFIETKEIIDRLNDELENRLVNKGINAKNPSFIIFLLANHFDYSRVDKKVEIKDEDTDKVVFKFNLKKPNNE